MRRTLLNISAGIALSGLTLGGAQAAGCDDTADKAAFHVRALQTELMVAALTCGAKPDYNAFATKFQTTLIDHGRALKRQFRAQHGAAGERQLNGYVTALANKASQKSLHSRDSYCSRAGRTFAALAQMPADELAAFAMARPAGDVDVPSSCRPNVTLVDRTQ